ncbi:MAG: hypothetical protein M3Y08_18210 [Fibrobacterota bacterium]|nr:hypothetical protein [Fibrobacterota bacterium]
MSYEAFRPISNVNTKETTAINLNTSASSQLISMIGGNVVIIATFTSACYIRFGGEATTVDSTNGFHVPAGAVIRMCVPQGATKLAVLQDGSAGAVSILLGSGV